MEAGEDVDDGAAPPDAAVLSRDPETLDGERPGCSRSPEIAEAEGRRDARSGVGELLGKELQRSAADAAADEQGTGDAVHREGAAQRAGEVDLVAHLLLAKTLAPRSPGLDKQADAVAAHGEERERPAEEKATPGHRDHHELPGRRLGGGLRGHDLELAEGAEVADARKAPVDGLRPQLGTGVLLG